VPDSANAGGREAGGGSGRSRRSRWIDRIVGVLLGILLGLGVIVVFVFYGSEGTIDAPRISGVDTGKPSSGGPFGGRKRAPLVTVIGGAPPSSGPVRLDYRQGGQAVFVVDSDAAITIAIPGYGVRRAIPRGRATIAFAARKAGQFPVIVAASHIDIATMRVARR
jgi:hypothetical protein